MEKQTVVSIDTNVLVRFLVEDKGATEQCQSARELFTRCVVFIPESVFLETEWVLRAVYGVKRDEIYAAFNKMLRLEQIQLPDKSVLRQVLAQYESGFDFADALHLIRGEGFEMKTFDSNFVKRAREAGYAASNP
jgi:predicted nucleic-acid-binding protein